MFRTIALALSAAATVAVPAVADAHGRYHDGRGYSNYGYAQGYAYPSYGYSQGYGYPSYGYSQSYGYPSYGYSQGYPAYGYGQSSYGYDGYNGYNGGYNRYCRNNAGTGVAIGGVAGAVLGSSVAGSNHRYSRDGYGYRRGGGDRTAGALIGGVLGAVVGGAIASGNC